MTNRELADYLRQFADLMEIKGENAFRVSAFRRGADTIKNSEESITERVLDGTVTEIKGVGSGIAAVLEDLVTSGNSSDFERLLDEVPGTLLTLLGIPGVGPKTVGRLYRELSVTNLQELEAAADSGHVRSLKGLGAKQEQLILDGIAFIREQSDRISIGSALPSGQRIVAELATRLTAQVELAGSTRRMVETVANVDVVIDGVDEATLKSELAKIVDSKTIQNGDDGRIHATMSDGARIRFAVTDQESAGAQLVYWTGSPRHVEELRALGTDPLTSTAPTEEAFYADLGIAFIPPEMREGHGEVEHAKHDDLPELIDVDDLRGDLHLHSEWSDGRGTLEDLSAVATELGYEFLSIADHSYGLGIARGLDEKRLRQQWALIDQLNATNPNLRLLKSCEVEIRSDGTLDFDETFLAEFDVVVASLHTGLRMPRAQVTDRILKVIENPHVDIIGHPSGRIIGRRPGANYDWEKVFEAAARTRTALEINSNPARLDLRDEDARRALEAGCLLTVNTDAHDPQSLNMMHFGVGVARRAWATADQVINTWSLDQLESWLGREL